MKKFSLYLVAFMLLTAFTCENEPLEGDFTQENEASCELAAQNTQNAALAFLEVNETNYTQLCTAYKNALQAQIQFCGDPDGILQTQLDSLGNCSNDNEPDDCATATTAADTAEVAFNNATDDNYTTLCNAYKVALENQIDVCGDDGSVQAIIDNLGNCEQSSTSGTLSVSAGSNNIQFVERSAEIVGDMVVVNGNNMEQGADYQISFEVPVGLTGVDVMQNFTLTLNGGTFFPNTDGFDDFTNNITVNADGVIQGTFGGIVTREDGTDLSLSQGIVDLTY